LHILQNWCNLAGKKNKRKSKTFNFHHKKKNVTEEFIVTVADIKKLGLI
jgi:hypothetical protein